MAIFEKKYSNKVVIDDTDRLICVIENTQNINRHTEYRIRVQRGNSNNEVWQISKRYSDFVSLHNSLHTSGIHLPFPPKKLIGNMQPSFIVERQIGLQNYLDEILKHHVLAQSLVVKKFLDPVNYAVLYHELALQNVSMALRGDDKYNLKCPLQDVGWRIQKHFYLVSSPKDPSAEHIMSWQTYGPDRQLSGKDLQAAFKSLKQMSHPYIDKIHDVQCLEVGVYVVRDTHVSGSVRDQLYGCTYNGPYLSKYGNPKTRKPFTTGQLIHYGLQILQALRFLNEKCLPYGHLHPGNIVIENQNILLLDIENGLLGAPSIYRSYFLEHKKIDNMEAIDVYCFGRTLYEMAFGEPLELAYCDNFPGAVSTELESLLRLCLSSSSCKRGMPSLDCLLGHPFFSGSKPISNGISHLQNHKPHIKFPLQIKDALKGAIGNIESRLKQDQKWLRKEKKQVRIQNILNSEEEMKKQKRRTQRQHSASMRSLVSPDGVGMRDERSNSIASTLSTTSTPTPPQNNGTGRTSASTSQTSSSPAEGRSALLSAICAFKKDALHHVNSR